MRRPALIGGVVKAIGGRSIAAIASDASVDRMGDVVVPSGGDFAAFKRNPIVLFSHDITRPVARASDIRVANNQVLMNVTFPPAGVSSLADEICGLVKAGILNALSIGFEPTEGEPVNPQRPYAGTRFTRWTLLECSIVSVPTNPNAVVVERGYAARRRMSSGAVSGGLGIGRPAAADRTAAPARRLREVEIELLAMTQDPDIERRLREVDVHELSVI